MEKSSMFMVAILSFLSLPVLSATIVLDPLADAYVNSKYAGSVYGSNQLLDVRASTLDAATPWGTKTYIKFGLDSVTDPISEVTLSFHYRTSNHSSDSGSNSAYDAILFGLNDAGSSGQPNESWSESGISWNNAPANVTGTFAGTDSIDGGVASQLTTLVVPHNISGWPDWQVTGQQLIDFVNADTNDLLTFILVPRYRDGETMELLSKDDTEFPSIPAPRLTITTVPLPPAMFLFMSALVGLGFVGRRKRMSS